MITPENRHRLRMGDYAAIVERVVNSVARSFLATVAGFEPGGYIRPGPRAENEHIVMRSAPAGTFPVSPVQSTIIDQCELIAWRKRGGRLQLAVEELLAKQGDAATRETISLQHDLVELRRAPFGGLPLTAIEQPFP